MKIKKHISFLFTGLLLLQLTSVAQDDQVLQYEMETRWTDQVDEQMPWPEYPRPQMVRENWKNLNGKWQYAIQPKNEGKPVSFQGEILVPFAVESSLSQVKKMVGEDNYLWYKRSFIAPETTENQRLLLHFGAVDWETVVFLNGEEVGTHKGGYDPFFFDISEYLKSGEQELVVRVWDPTDKGTQARGKQVANPRGIWYTPVTGIWQTVWLETVPHDYFRLIKTTPDIDRHQATMDVQYSPLQENSIIKIKILDKGSVVTEKEIPAGARGTRLTTTLTVPEPKLWSPESPFLYDLHLTLQDTEGNVIDQVESYFGMRKVSLGKDANGYTRMMLNNEPVFQFGLLDQGWWPDGLYTPPTEEAMLYDVKVTKDLGFNMLRKHVKVEPARFYYHCDKMGMLVWQDMPNGNYFRDLRIEAWEKEDAHRPLESAVQFENELQAMMDHFHQFPSILVWVPFNEGWGQYDTERVTRWSEAYDPSRLIDSPSGWADRGVGDIIDIHIYPGPGMELPEQNRASVIGEFGGLGWPVEDHLWWNKKNWGYLTYQEQEKFQQEFQSLITDLQSLIGWGLSAAIYTQTTDVEGEVNGLMTYDREVIKLDPAETRDLLAPLYQPWWNKREVVRDSEQKPQEWKVMFEPPKGNWKQSDFNDLKWQEAMAPFSIASNPFLPRATEWNSSKLYLRKSFHLDEIPANFYIRHFIPGSDVKVFINGQLVEEFTDAGGRKRHYTNRELKNAGNYLQTGKNILAVEVTRQEGKDSNDRVAFDMGLYFTEMIGEPEALQQSYNLK